jgi:hypothetical protein
MFKWVFSIITLLLPTLVFSQRWEIGMQAGPSNYQGDLAPDIELSETHFCGGIFIKKNLSQYFSLCFSAMEGKISGQDKNISSQKIRNLSFQSTITELSYQLEFNFFPFSFGLNPKKFTPYVATGLSAFMYDPKSMYNNHLVKLKPLDTEGKKLSEKKKSTYSLIQFAIPIGGGLKFNLSEKYIVGVNLSFRYTFTDYLDDVSTSYYDPGILSQQYGEISANMSDRSSEVNSEKVGFMGKQRGRSDLKDWYIFGGIFISHKIKNSACFEF